MSLGPGYRRVRRNTIRFAGFCRGGWGGLFLIVVSTLWLPVFGSPGCAVEDDADAIDVFAAASVADSVEAIAGAYSNQTSTKIRVSRGASGLLCQQIENGATCDVFVPAHPRFIERLERHAGISISNRAPVARNRLAMIYRQGFVIDSEPATNDGDSARRTIAGALDRAQRVAIANVDHAPAGQYALQAIGALGLSGRLKSRLVYGDDVRLTARYVAEGVVDCGLVYVSDAKAFEGQIGGCVVVPEGLCDSIEYDACVVGRDKGAAAFVAFLASEQAAKIWRDHGFRDVSGAASE